MLAPQSVVHELKREHHLDHPLRISRADNITRKLIRMQTLRPLHTYKIKICIFNRVIHMHIKLWEIKH